LSTPSLRGTEAPTMRVFAIVVMGWQAELVEQVVG